MRHRINEIRSYLEHHDLSLARRRLLDLTLDAGNKNILQQAISWSKRYSLQLQDIEASVVDTDFYTEAQHLLQQLEATATSVEQQPKALLKATGVSKTYARGNFSLQAVSLSVSSGCILGIVGENGNGKTTLLRCLSGQLAIDSGGIDYLQLSHPDHYDIKHHVAFIPQRIPRWYGLLKDNLHFAASLTGIYGDDNEMMVDFMLERMNLTQYAHLTWSQISSGYRTRFEIARVLLQKPSLLILDEPLANLDIVAQQTVLTDLRYMATSTHHPMGILLSSQQLHEVEKIADNVLFIKRGECLYQRTDSTATTTAVIEVETTADREQLVQVFNSNIQVQFNGGYFTLSSDTLSPQQMIQSLTASGIPLTYFRDITHSTKRFF